MTEWGEWIAHDPILNKHHLTPEEDNVYVQVKLRDDTTDEGEVEEFVWGRIRENPENEIVAYRLPALFVQERPDFMIDALTELKS